jgi:transcriptional regulator with XRE-family HTH domain
MSTGIKHAEGVSKSADLPPRAKSINQLIGYNMAEYRQAAGLTQEELGKRLGGWTKVAVSAAERSWDGKRVRKFDADEIVAIATALGVPVPALLLPPAAAGTAAEYTFTAGTGEQSEMSTAALLRRALLIYGEAHSGTMDEFHQRLMALGISEPVPPSVQEADEMLGRARTAADDILNKSRNQAERITSDARARAESLERDAQERHRQAMGALVQQREELERRVDDLRAFEREYRSRFMAYLEGLMRDLQAGADDTGGFRAMGKRSGRSQRRTTARPEGGDAASAAERS